MHWDECTTFEGIPTLGEGESALAAMAKSVLLHVPVPLESCNNHVGLQVAGERVCCHLDCSEFAVWFCDCMTGGMWDCATCFEEGVTLLGKWRDRVREGFHLLL